MSNISIIKIIMFTIGFRIIMKFCLHPNISRKIFLAQLFNNLKENLQFEGNFIKDNNTNTKIIEKDTNAGTKINAIKTITAVFI